MVGIVGRDDHRHQARRAPTEQGDAFARDEAAVIVGGVDDVGEAEQEPAVQLLAESDRRPSSQPGVERIGIVADLGGVRVEVGDGHRTASVPSKAATSGLDTKRRRGRVTSPTPIVADTGVDGARAA